MGWERLPHFLITTTGDSRAVHLTFRIGAVA